MENQYGQMEQILKLTEDTNKIVRRMQRRNRVSSFFRIVYVCFFLYISWWGYKEMLPYIDQMKALIVQVQEMNKTAEEMSKSVNDAKINISPEVLKLLDKLPR